MIASTAPTQKNDSAPAANGAAESEIGNGVAGLTLAPTADARVPTMFDAHCHLTDTPAQLANLPTLATGTVALMGTRLGDWDLVADTFIQNPTRAIAGFGIHPWFAEATEKEHPVDDVYATPAWIKMLKRRLRRFPHAFVGEIGVDRIATHPDRPTVKYDWDAQVRVFRHQWQLAAAMQRPVSVHMVQAPGWFQDFVRAEAKRKDPTTWPRAIMLHSFSGSVELLQQLLRLGKFGKRLYFSYSVFVNSRSPKFHAQLQATPDDRLLIESDVHKVDLVDSAMELVLEAVCQAKNWTHDEAIRITAENARHAFGLPADGLAEDTVVDLGEPEVESDGESTDGSESSSDNEEEAVGRKII
ncbi:hypothetical protein GGF31_000007 [Allomyces arbusculus]|nr:hypothetical protein GGF31_000007 [Allomyces arbusculus]